MIIKKMAFEVVTAVLGRVIWISTGPLSVYNATTASLRYELNKLSESRELCKKACSVNNRIKQLTYSTASCFWQFFNIKNRWGFDECKS